MFSQKLFRLSSALFLACLGLIAGCNFGPRYAYHSFSFDTGMDTPEDIEILDFQYGTHPMAHSSANRSNAWGMPQSMRVTGGMPVGEFLFVRWRINATNEILEDKVDLRNRLPWNMEDQKIHFVVRDRQLYIYVVTSERRPPGWPYYGSLGGSGHRKAYMIYPHNHLK